MRYDISSSAAVYLDEVCTGMRTLGSDGVNSGSVVGLEHVWRISPRPATATRTVGLYLLPDFSRFELFALIEAFEKANEVLSSMTFHLVTIPCGDETCADWRGWTENLRNPPSGIAEDCNCLIVLGGSLREWPKNVAASLRRHHRHGGTVAALSTGVLTLVRSGLLDGRRCAAHWYLADAVQDLSSKVELSPLMVEVDGRCVTSAGGVAALDLALALISIDLGQDAAQIVAEAFCYNYSSISYPQPISLRRRLGTSNRHLVSATKAMAENLETPLSRSEIAASAGVSVRQLERLFERYLGISPLQFYKEMRLRKARRLLRETDLSIMEVACRTGYVSGSHFAQSYRNQYGASPSRDRNRSSNGTPEEFENSARATA